jgi:hypothetical protein
MTNQHPIMPPDELVQQWRNSKILLKDALMVAAQWGADQELEACCELLRQFGFNETLPRLQRIRRPKPPSLKEQAMCALIDGIARGGSDPSDIETIRRALEALPE